MSTEVRLFKHSQTNQLLVARPHIGEEPSVWLARHLRFCRPGKAWKIVFDDEPEIAKRFVPVEDLADRYRRMLQG